VGSFTGTLDVTQTVAAQTAKTIADGLTTWESIRANLAGGGQAFYFSADQPISCSGCTSSTHWGALQLQVDFTNRTIGGTGLTNPYNGRYESFIHVHGLYNAGNADTVESTIPNAISFDSLTGNATLPLSGHLSSVSCSGTGCAGFGTGNFSGSSVDLLNAGGVEAKTAETHLDFSGTNSMSSPNSASGTFLAPRNN
jgi:hypothetical protein